MTEKMCIEDLNEVIAIETAVFPDPWGRGMFLSELSHPFSLAYVEKEDAQIVGYILLWQVLDELWLMNFAVHPAKQRRGIGENLLHFAFRLGEERGASKVLLEVRASNLGAQRLYQQFGFRQVGVRRNYYRAPKEDGLLFDCWIKETPR